MKPILDPQRDLKGATPEALARALFRSTNPLRSPHGVEPIISDKVAVEKVPADHADDSVAHLRDGV